MDWTNIAEVFFVSLITAFLITPLMRVIAKRTGYMDAPEDTKAHARATPLLGGVGMYLAFIIGVLTTLKIGPQHARITSVFAGGGLLLIIGLIDDKFGMMPNVKLLGQFLAAMIMVKSGVRVDFIANDFLSILLTYVWIIGITNAFNLLDNLNGLSAGTAAISAFFFGIIAWGSKQPELAILSFAFCGACLGFLKHNFPKASIFMGDSGSLFIGFTLSGIAILGSWKTINITLTLMVPILILAYPIFDTTLVTLLRLKERRSIFDGGKDHSSHRLALLGLKKKRSVLVIYSIGIVCGVAALLLTKMSFHNGLILLALVVLAMFALGVRLAMVDTTRYGRKKKPSRR